MAASIMAFFDWRCDLPLPLGVVTSLEAATRECAPLLEPLGLLGSVGTTDVWSVDDDPDWQLSKGVVIRRLDLPEMKLLLTRGSAAMEMALLWGFYAANRERRGELSRLMVCLAEHLRIRELFVAPHGLEACSNLAFEKVCEGRPFAEVKECLLLSRYAWGIEKSAKEEWQPVAAG